MYPQDIVIFSLTVFFNYLANSQFTEDRVGCTKSIVLSGLSGVIEVDQHMQ